MYGVLGAVREASGGVGHVRGLLGAGMDSRYSGERRGIGSSRDLWGLPGGVGVL